jgi:hypothetical protein
MTLPWSVVLPKFIPLSTRDQHGKEHLFHMTIEVVPHQSPGQEVVPALQFRVYRSRGRPPEEGCFHACFVRLGEDQIKSAHLDNRIDDEKNPIYSAKGITEALFDHVARQESPFEGDSAGSRVLVSSSHRGPTDGECRVELRTEDSTKVWDRLRIVGRATYDKDEDRYTYVPC